jgi:hypothetical protein
MDIGELTTGREIPVTFGPKAFKITYRPEMATREKLREYTRQLEEAPEGTALDVTMEFICDLVAGWEITKGGEPIPITPETLANDVPLPVLNAIRAAIYSDVGEAPKPMKTRSMNG